MVGAGLQKTDHPKMGDPIMLYRRKRIRKFYESSVVRGNIKLPPERPFESGDNALTSTFFVFFFEIRHHCIGGQ